MNEKEAWDWLKNHLSPGMNAEPSEFVSKTAADVIKRNKERLKNAES